MRNLMIIGMLLVAAFMAGWFKINRDGENTTIEINRNEIRQDAESAISRGRAYLDQYDVGKGEGVSGLVSEAEGALHLSENAQWAREQVAAQGEQWGRNYDSQTPSYAPSAFQPQPAPNYLPPRQ